MNRKYSFKILDIRAKNVIEKFFSVLSRDFRVKVESEGKIFSVDIYRIDWDDSDKTVLRRISDEVEEYFDKKIPNKDKAARFLAKYKNKTITPDDVKSSWE